VKQVTANFSNVEFLQNGRTIRRERRLFLYSPALDRPGAPGAQDPTSDAPPAKRPLLTVTATPEPGSYNVVGLGALGPGAKQCRRGSA